MTWHYGIRQHRLVEVFPGMGDDGGDAYAVLGWRDLLTIFRNARWVVRDVLYDRRRS